MSPWPLLIALTALINLAAFVAVRGRWGRLVPVLALAAAAGAAAGDVVGAATGLELMPIGDYHPAAASIGAQLAMLVTSLLTALVPAARGE